MPGVRKQIYDLTEADLAETPVWEFAHSEDGDDEDDQDEATVRPVPVEGVLDPAEGTYVVRATFTLADGSRHIGQLTTPFATPFHVADIQPAITTPDGQVAFWCGILKPSPDDMSSMYAMLRKSPQQVFPLTFRSDIPLASGPVEGMIEGFLVFKHENWMQNREFIAFR